MVKDNQKKLLTKSVVKHLARYVLCCLFIAVLLWQYSENKTTSLHYLDQQGKPHSFNLPVKDKKRLAALMQQLFAHDSFAYTILGSKPISWGSYQNPLPITRWTDFFDSFSKYHRIMRSGWKTWEKYQHLFPSAHLWAERPPCYPGAVSILIINEDRFNDVVNQHKKDFQEVLHREIVDGSQLIREAKNRSLMDEVLEGHQALLGIVLGYGRENSWKFLEGCNTRTPIGWVWEGQDDLFFERSLPDLNLSDTDYALSLYSCPSFAGDPHSEESLALKADYLETRQKVLDYYKDKDFLEATFSLLARYYPQ